MRNSFESVFAFNQGDGAAVGNTLTPTSLLPAAAKYRLWSNYFENLGQLVKVTAHGRISTVVTTPGTLTLQLRLTDTTPTTVSVFDSGAMTLNVNAQTNVHWILEAFLRVSAVGSAGTVFGFGTFRSHAVIGSAAPAAGGAGQHMLPFNAAPAAGTAFDMTKDNQVDLFATWSIANASNTLTLHNFFVESMN